MVGPDYVTICVVSPLTQQLRLLTRFLFSFEMRGTGPLLLRLGSRQRVQHSDDERIKSMGPVWTLDFVGTKSVELILKRVDGSSFFMPMLTPYPLYLTKMDVQDALFVAISCAQLHVIDIDCFFFIFLSFEHVNNIVALRSRLAILGAALPLLLSLSNKVTFSFLY
ncbi:unnamed protein product [Sphenostylis stenocarpa]|uniref:Uncharacterized protein n=1 Tax=Sphenostylis stenocarpa TaxID=92480 RepID=A0AA86W049_9FABA|nr:unnamed protein product [Sphenostylis stenocarpa]